ncbi:tetrahydrofolylpolyglutamate synthase [Pyrrhoderma noxium]|uniref:Folylpolyglutamate synthase n=1 Tax=Pyrrhoderma noxium TaxID=2282107 RepID=A0A286UN12_9AGAM|nr:tetrahydrofolylpolyglutamate synthase [Pyrrhoderma noxium]
MATRSYKDAIDCLNSLQSNQATIEAARASGGRLEKFAMHETEEYLQRIGYSPQDLNRLNVIHVTGTKGKGSTCAFVDSLLRHSKPQWTVGLYTSPHLVAVRERIRVNGKPISEEDFARYFFEVWDRLEKNDTRKYESTSPKPMYFRMVTLVAFHAFSEMKVDATVLEVGVGGLYDCTNIIPKPVVTGVAALGIDHTAVLGNTLGSIAFQKGGIYKEGVPAFTVDQPKEGLEVLEQQAIDRKASKFTVVPTSSELLDIKLGLPGKHQYQNASLAVYLTQEFLRAKADLLTPSASTLSETFKEGLKNAKWPGRCQTVSDPTDKGTTWFLDGAHTKDSIECCIRWFFSPDVGFRETSSGRSRVLVFNCTNDRNGASLLSLVLSEAVDQFKLHKGVNVELKDIFDHVIFTSNITYTGGTFKSDLTSRTVVEEKVDPLKVQRGLSEAWSQLVPEFPKDNVHVMPSVEDTVRVIRDLKLQGSKEVDVLVSGSLHLVGGIIEVANLAEIAL